MGARFAVLLLAAGCATAPPASSPSAPEAPAGWRHAFVVDASSSASTLFAYRWRAGGTLPEIEARDIDCDRVEPGLGAFGGRPAEAAASLAPLVACAVDQVGGDPADLTSASLHLLGTAGLRLLPDGEQREILAAVRDALGAAGFGTASARVISGDEEGIYGWLSVNYLLGHLEHGGAFPTVGALDLGGASTQITFVPLELPREHGRPIVLGGNTYRLYTYSYLGLGQDEARATVGSPACYLDGYPIPDGGAGLGDFDACREAIRSALGEPCAEAPCSMFGVYQPPLYGDFLAFSVYAYTARFFGLLGQLSPAELERAGREFCARRWGDLVREDPSVAGNPFVPNYCFSAAYVVTLLTDGFGFPPATERVHALLEVQGAKTGWTLGALLYELAGASD